MKKVLSLTLTSCLLCFASIAMADTELDKNTLTGTTRVSLNIETVDSYTVIIPSEVQIDPTTKHGKGTITLKSGWVLGGESTNLRVRLAGAANEIRDGIYSGYDIPTSALEIENGSYQNFRLSKGDTLCSYAIKASNAEAPFTANAKCGAGGVLSSMWGTDPKYAGTYYKDFDLISVTRGGDNSTDKTCTLDFYVWTLPLAGEYEDTLTFSIMTGPIQ